MAMQRPQQNRKESDLIGNILSEHEEEFKNHKEFRTQSRSHSPQRTCNPPKRPTSAPPISTVEKTERQTDEIEIVGDGFVLFRGEKISVGDPRLSEGYAEYYYGQKPLDTRLPKPLFDWQVGWPASREQVTQELLSGATKKSISFASPIASNLASDNPEPGAPVKAPSTPPPVDTAQTLTLKTGEESSQVGPMLESGLVTGERGPLDKIQQHKTKSAPVEDGVSSKKDFPRTSSPKVRQAPWTTSAEGESRSFFSSGLRSEPQIHTNGHQSQSIFSANPKQRARTLDSLHGGRLQSHAGQNGDVSDSNQKRVYPPAGLERQFEGLRLSGSNAAAGAAYTTGSYTTPANYSSLGLQSNRQSNGSHSAAQTVNSVQGYPQVISSPVPQQAYSYRNNANPMMAMMGYGQKETASRAAPYVVNRNGVPYVNAPQHHAQHSQHVSHVQHTQQESLYQQQFMPAVSSYGGPRLQAEHPRQQVQPYWESRGQQRGISSGLAQQYNSLPTSHDQMRNGLPMSTAMNPQIVKPRRYQSAMGGALENPLSSQLSVITGNHSLSHPMHTHTPVGSLPAFQTRGGISLTPSGISGVAPGMSVNQLNHGGHIHSGIGAGTGIPMTVVPQDLRVNKANNQMSLAEIIHGNQVVDLATDQNGSRFIQQHLEKTSDEEKHSVFEQIQPETLRLCTDVFGNYVIQKLFEYGLPIHKQTLANELIGHVYELTLQMYGCRVIQKALEAVHEDQQSRLISELKGHVMQCIKDQNGNHVIQKCIEKVPPQYIDFIVNSFRGKVQELSTHPYGCRVIQRLLEHCTPGQKGPILDEIIRCIINLIKDQYGNYVVQHVLQRGSKDHRDAIIDVVVNNLLNLSKHKFASNVVEKCFFHGDEDQKEALVQAVIGEPKQSPLPHMVRDQFGNYVVQNILEVLSTPQRARIVKCITETVPNIRKIAYGKHIVACVEKLTGEVI